MGLLDAIMGWSSHAFTKAMAVTSTIDIIMTIIRYVVGWLYDY